tara:strand:+ start:3012 stop:6599 length:3588 start_codon:yes stop_codon:yes gene_type:complete
MYYLYKKLNDKIICYNILFNNKKVNYVQLYELFDTYNIELDLENKIEIGPIPNFTSSLSTNIKNILKKSNIDFIDNIEVSYIYDKDNYEYDKMTQIIYKNRLDLSKKIEKKDELKIDINELINDDKYGLSLEEEDKKYILENYKKWDNPIFIIYDISQSNSEHCRHHFFNGELYLNGQKIEKSLFDLVKEPLHNSYTNNVSLIAFNDNSSAIKGYENKILKLNDKYQYELKKNNLHFVLTAETHNFPTAISPFSGAATGIGGRIRDVQATGKGAIPIASSAGYCVGDLFNKLDYPSNISKPIDIIIQASNGASDYGNKFGEPIILGFCRSFHNNENDRIEWMKPIMFTSGIGLIEEHNLYKDKVESGMYIGKIGGPAYRIGFGGGSASSREISNSNNKLDYDAVQRDDPAMEEKMNRVISSCSKLDNNPILSIHDQGAGGNGNVLKEIIEKCGAKIDLGKITLGDKSMNDLEIWLSEYQESNAILFKDKKLLQQICDREFVKLDILGKTNNTDYLTIYNGYKTVVNKYKLLDNKYRKQYNLTTNYNLYYNKKIDDNLTNKIFNTLNLLQVGSKRFLTNKVDRSVSGLIAQQQCVGPLHTPLSNFSLIASSYYPNNMLHNGCATSIGEQPIFGLINPMSLVHKTFGEALLNLVWVVIEDIKSIRCSANWMWPCPHKDSNEGYNMYIAMKELKILMNYFGIAIDGGKDSLSMVVNHNNKKVKSPGSLVLTFYASVPNIYNKVTPNLKRKNSLLLYIDLGENYDRLGGSSYNQSYNFIGSEGPLIRNREKLLQTFKLIQKLIKDKIIFSGHDISDGGLITTLIEMSISSNIGLLIGIPYQINDVSNYLFNEELGVVIEIDQKYLSYITSLFHEIQVNINTIAVSNNSNIIEIEHKNNIIFNKTIADVRNEWENTSFKLEKLQCEINCVYDEKDTLYRFQKLEYNFNNNHFINPISNINRTIGIIREEGSNSDREMASAFYHAGFKIIDINTYDLLKRIDNFDDLDGIVFVGGFTFSDVLGSSKGWYSVIKNNDKINKIFEDFYERDDIFSLGVCNGCQLMCKLGWVYGELLENKSGRFESRFSNIKVTNTDNLFFKNLDINFGMWVAHKEGRFKLMDDSNVCLKYVDEYNNPTSNYPYNPNNSDYSCAGLLSKNKRHLALMPHPERSYLNYQIPYSNISLKSSYSPWFSLFANIKNNI